jgi:hypothetical protein
MHYNDNFDMCWSDYTDTSTTITTPFKITCNAPADSLYIDSSGELRLNVIRFPDDTTLTTASGVGGGGGGDSFWVTATPLPGIKYDGNVYTTTINSTNAYVNNGIFTNYIMFEDQTYIIQTLGNLIQEEMQV